MTDEGASPVRDGVSKKSFRKKVIKYSFLILFTAFIVSITAIAHIFGPYMGKVVDLETGEPIDGAAVLMVFYTESFFASSAYAGAVETLTDPKGEFRIPWYLALTFHPFSVWEPHGYVIIFRPGFGAYPDHKKALPRFKVGGTLPENEYVTIRLPLLKTLEERKDNLFYIPGIPERKMQNLLRLEGEERVSRGLKP
jgi:hypothetical protein